MPFSFHFRQEKDLQAHVRYIARPSPNKKPAHLVVIQGPTGCGKTYVLKQALAFFSPKTTRIIRNEDLFQIFKLGLSQAGAIRYLYLGKYKYVVLALDDWPSECQPVEMAKFVKWLDALLSRPSVPKPTLVFVTCVDTFHGNASKLYTFIAPPKKRWTKKKKQVADSPPPVKRWVKNIRLFAPKDYLLEKYIRGRGVKNSKRISELVTWCRGDLRQLNLLRTDRLAYLSAKSSSGASTVPRETHIFELTRSIFEGGARDGELDAESTLSQRESSCVRQALNLLAGVTREPNERILDFLLENQYRPSDQNASLGFADEARDAEFLKYQSQLADDLSFFDATSGASAGYVSNGHLENIVRSMAMHAGHLDLDECELDDSIKIAPPKQTLAQLRRKQAQCAQARQQVMSSCFWYAGDEAVGQTLTRSNPQLYLDFLAGTLTSADQNYGNFSDRLQHISKEDMNRVFPPCMLRAVRIQTSSAPAPVPKSAATATSVSMSDKLFMPF